MPISRKYIVEDDHQILNVDFTKRFVQNDGRDWQIVFNPSSSLDNSTQAIKIAAEFDTNDLSSVRFIGYLYRANTGSIDSAASCTFNIYLVGGSNINTWNETLLGTFTGTVQPNSYFLSDIDVNSLLPANLDGDSTLMVEAVIIRKARVYRDRVYFNHLGIFDSMLRLKNEVEYLDITKQDE